MYSTYLKGKVSHSLLLSIILMLAVGTFLSGCAGIRAHCGASGYDALKKGDYRTASTQYYRALWLCEKDNHKKGVVLNLNNVGCSFYGLGEYSKALDNYKKGSDLAYEINYKKHIPYAVLNIAITSATIGDFDTATHYLHKLNIDNLPKDLKSYFWAIKGKIYVDKEQYELGLDYEMKGLELAKSKTNLEKHDKAELIEDIALAFLKKGDYKKAYQYANDSLALVKSTGFSIYQWKTPYILGKYFERQGNDQEAKNFYNESVSRIKEIKAKLRPEHKKYFTDFTKPVFVALNSYERRQQALPANLVAKIQYSDKSSLFPNSTIDAKEESTITATITNEGKGTAFDVKLATESDYQHIQFPEIIPVGDIQPGKSKEVKIDIKSDLDLADGTVPFWIVCKEKRGYDSKKYNLNVPAVRLERPVIAIANYKINDGNTGLARGNGNGIPENGETIELIPFVKNNGVGKALKVKLSIASINQGIEVKRRSVTIPHILPGQTVTANLAFSIPRMYSGGKIEIDFTASDVRGASEARKVFAINTESHRPVLVYTYRIIDRNGNDVLENGEEGEIEIVPANKGKMEARDLRVSLQSDGLVFSKKHSKIEYIPAGSKYSPLRFAFKVPRTFQNDSVDVRVQFDQQDFPGLTDRISIPIRLALPDFEIAHQILDRNNNGVIEQGETIDLIVKVRNTGRLDADSVVLNISAGPDGDIKEGVRLIGDKTMRIGRLAAGSESESQTFTIHVQHRAGEGNLPLHFTIKQKDFSDKDLSLALNIVPEQAEVITVAGQRPKQVYSAPTTIYNAPPVIAIASPRNNNKVASEFVMFSGTIADDKGVADIDIFVNGRSLDTSRGIGVVGKDSGDQRKLRFNRKIPLRMGKNEITITAFDIENLSSSETLTLHREAEMGEMWAAVIGINGYQQRSKIPALSYAGNDARAFAEYLRENMGFDRKHLFELYDSEATVLNMRSLLGTKLRKKADKPEDTVLIFFAGHGAPEEDPGSDDRDGITKYILAYNSDPEDLYSTAIPMNEIARIFSRIKAQRVIFIADSCYSGGSGGRTILAPRWRANISDSFLDRIARAGKGRIILTSSNANEVSQESDKLRHGYFTYYLLEGLKGAADVSEDGLIDVNEIYLYLNKWVPRATGGSQHPVKKGEAEGQVIIGRVK